MWAVVRSRPTYSGKSFGCSSFAIRSEAIFQVGSPLMYRLSPAPKAGSLVENHQNVAYISLICRLECSIRFLTCEREPTKMCRWRRFPATCWNAWCRNSVGMSCRAGSGGSQWSDSLKRVIPDERWNYQLYTYLSASTNWSQLCSFTDRANGVTSFVVLFGLADGLQGKCHFGQLFDT